VLLRRTHTKTRLRCGILRAPDGQSENIGIKPPRFFDVTDIDRHMIDSRDTRPTAFFGGARRKHYARQREAEHKQLGTYQCWEGSRQAPHTRKFYLSFTSAVPSSFRSRSQQSLPARCLIGGMEGKSTSRDMVKMSLISSVPAKKIGIR
jgi:hypothetical protein